MNNLFRKEFNGGIIYDREKHALSYVDNITDCDGILDFSSPLHILTPEYLVAPLRVYLELTKKCNLRCKMCITNSGEKQPDELDNCSWNKIIKGLRRDGVFEVRFTGGEPTKRGGWSKLARKVKDLGMVFSLTTNGILDNYSMSKLIGIKPEEISISLDGGEKTHDFLRGIGTHRKIVKNIDTLLDNDCNVSINSLLSRYTSKEDIAYLLNFSKEKEIEVSFFHIRPIGRATGLLDIQINLDHLISFNNYILLLKKKKSIEKVKVGSPTLNGIIDGPLSFPASDGFYRLNILYDGSVYAGGCVPYVSKESRDQYNLGNIKNENYSILNIWNNSRKLKQQRNWIKGLRDRCDGCENERCPTFTTEMEVYARQFGENKFCNKFNLKRNIYKGGR